MTQTSSVKSTAAPATPSHATSATTSSQQTSAPKYAQSQPAQQALTLPLLWRQAMKGLSALARLSRHTLGVFDPMPKSIQALTPTEPDGCIDPKMLDVCQHLANGAELRLSRLETKATGHLSLIALVIPLTASAAVFVRQHAMLPSIRWLSLALNLGALLLFLLALIASLRALAVRGQQELFLDAVIDPATDKVRTYSADFFGRGLLYITAVRQAICDQIADFVRAAQVFLVLGVAFATFSAAAVLFQIQEETQVMQGTLMLDSSSLAVLRRDVDAKVDAHIDELERQIESLRREQPDLRTEAELQRLSKQVAELQRLVSARSKQRATNRN